MRAYKLFSTLLLLLSFATATVYEDGKEGTTNRWRVTDNNPTGAIVCNTFDSTKDSNVIQFVGEGRKNSYTIGDTKNEKGWKNDTEKTLRLSINFKKKYQIYVYLKTKKGNRVIGYDYKERDRGRDGKYIRIGLGLENKDEEGWINIERNLEEDLQQYEPSNHIEYVSGIKFKGSGRVDDIELINKDDENNDDEENSSLIISDVKAIKIKKHSAKISWKTNLPSISYIEYGLTMEYGEVSEKTDEYKRTNQIELKDLESNTTYHYRVISQDEEEEESFSKDYTFSTTGVIVDEFHSKDAFITKWEIIKKRRNTNLLLAITTDDDFAYDFNIDWGDGKQNRQVTKTITHQYEQEGNYTVSIIGKYPKLVHLCYSKISRRHNRYYRLLSVEQWGTQKWKSMSKFFQMCSVFDKITDPLAPDLSEVTSMASMFYYAGNFNRPINHWDVSHITNMSDMFNGANLFNQDIVTEWDISKVTDMSGMFSETEAFNQDISQWDVSHVIYMNRMFSGAKAFNQDISNWDISNITDMSGMFSRAKAFNQDIGKWDISAVTNMSSMFNESKSFNQDIGNWDVSNVTDMSSMFSKAESFNQDISNWDVSNVTNMRYMFGHYHHSNNNVETVFNQDIGEWDVSQVTDMSYMFSGATAFNQDIGDWDVSQVNNMRSMFSKAKSFNQDITNWDVSNVTNMNSMFKNSKSFNQDISNWDVSNVTNMNSMFKNSKAFNQDIGKWNISNVYSMNDMFYGATVFNQDISNWDISKLHKNYYSFESNIISLKESAFSTKNYDKLLKEWSKLSFDFNSNRNKPILNMGDIQYSKQAKDAHDKLSEVMEIKDGGIKE